MVQRCRNSFCIKSLFLIALFGLSTFVGNADAQDESEEQISSNLLKNSGFEESKSGMPTEWQFPRALANSGFKYESVTDNPSEGEKCGWVSTVDADLSNQRFGILNQFPSVDAVRGKRVRFRAAVRVDDLSEDGRACLWLRADRKDKKGKYAMGAFDNMSDRPIKSSEWKHYEIIADIEEDATKLTVGMLVLGKANAWIDDASLEIIDKESADVAVTTMLRADNAPKQAFYTHWLWLAAFVMVLFYLSQLKNSLFQRFALRFSVGYWLLYSLPSPILETIGGLIGLLGKFGVSVEKPSQWLASLATRYQETSNKLVEWTAANVLGMEGKLTFKVTGSGDTTVDFVNLMVCFLGAMLIAVIWSGALYWRKTDQVWIRDLLRTYLRYVLAFSMMGYGLAKAGFIATQFAPNGLPYEGQLARSYGDSSPMGLLWTFMAVSPMYTFLAGLGETVGGLLLLFRRTTTIGAFVVIGVMANVVMLNFCYDVPVKQYSFHLSIMAVFLVLPELPRLLNVLLLNRATEPSESLDPPYTNSKTVWIYRAAKAFFVVILFAMPVYEHVKKEVTHEHPEAVESDDLLMSRGFRWINEVPFNR